MTECTMPFLRDDVQNTKRTICGLTIDFGRQRMTAEDLKGLYALAREKGVLEQNAAMRRGEIVNPSEGRAALHTALRDPRVNAPFHADVDRALERICLFADRVRSGRYCGCRGDKITDVINIGIGGSDLGPRMVCQALRPFHVKGINVHSAQLCHPCSIQQARTLHQAAFSFARHPGHFPFA